MIKRRADFMPMLEQEVNLVFGCDIQERTKRTPVKLGRFAFAHVSSIFGFSSDEIGLYLSKDHVTILHAKRMCEVIIRDSKKMLKQDVLFYHSLKYVEDVMMSKVVNNISEEEQEFELFKVEFGRVRNSVVSINIDVVNKNTKVVLTTGVEIEYEGVDKMRYLGVILNTF